MVYFIVYIFKNAIALLNTKELTKCFLVFYNTNFKNVGIQCCLAFKTHRNVNAEYLCRMTHTVLTVFSYTKTKKLTTTRF